MKRRKIGFCRNGRMLRIQRPILFEYHRAHIVTTCSCYGRQSRLISGQQLRRCVSVAADIPATGEHCHTTNVAPRKQHSVIQNNGSTIDGSECIEA